MKDSVALSNSISILKYGLDRLEKHPSTAKDTGEPERQGKHLMQIVLNKLSGLSEIADTQAAACLIGLPSQSMTTGTTYIFIHSAVAFVKHIEQMFLQPDRSSEQVEATAYDSSVITASQDSVNIFDQDLDDEDDQNVFFSLTEASVRPSQIAANIEDLQKKNNDMLMANCNFSPVQTSQVLDENVLIDNRDTCCNSTPHKV